MKSLLIVLASLLFTTLSLAADWPQFGGANRDGIAPDKGLAASWPEGGPKELWKLDLNVGFGGAAVVAGKVYIADRTTERGQEKDVLLCLDLADGSKKWSLEFDAPGRLSYPGPRATPAVDDTHLFYTGPMGDVYCVDLKTQKLAWKKNVVKDYRANLARWGMAASPLLYKDTVVVAPQGREAGLAALDRKSGKEIWKSESIGGMAYTSPLLTTIDKVEQIVLIGANKAVGVEPGTGKILWDYCDWGTNRVNMIPSITPLGDGRLLITAGYGVGCRIIHPKLADGKWKVSELFNSRDISSMMHNAILFDKHLYLNSAATKKDLLCMDLDGKVKWSQPGLTDTGGNLVIADGKIYLMDGRNGTLRMIEASPDGFKELAKAQVLAGGQVWAPMAISDGKLLCRDQKQLKCLDISGK